MNPEGDTQSLLGNAQRNQRITRRRPHPFSQAIQRQKRGDAERAIGGEQPDPAQQRHAVSHRRRLLVALQPVGDRRTGELNDPADPLIQAIEHAELRRRHTQKPDQIGRQDAGDHLGGYIGEEAGDAKRPDIRRDRRRQLA